MEAIKMESVNLQGVNDKLDRLIELVSVPKEVFSAKEAAAYLCIGYDALMRYARIGVIRSATNGSSRIFKKAWLDEWLEEGGSR